MIRVEKLDGGKWLAKTASMSGACVVDDDQFSLLFDHNKTRSAAVEMVAALIDDGL